jgi:hypothetical protein
VINRPKQRMYKVSCCLLLQAKVFMHAAAGVNGQDDLQRKLRLAFKNGDLLRVVILGELKLVPGQAGHRSSFVIGNIDEDIHQANIHADGWWLGLPGEWRPCLRLAGDSAESKRAANGRVA